MLDEGLLSITKPELKRYIKKGREHRYTLPSSDLRTLSHANPEAKIFRFFGINTFFPASNVGTKYQFVPRSFVIYVGHNCLRFWWCPEFGLGYLDLTLYP